MEIVNLEKNKNDEIMSYFKGEKDGYVQVGKSKWFLPVKFRQLAEDYKNFEVREDDIWIMGYPRSGTTLTEEIVWLLTHNLDFERITETRVRFFENSTILNEKTLQEIVKEYPNQAANYQYKRESLKHLKNDKTRRVIKTHLPFELLPDDILKKGCKVIYVCRYPKDVCVSHYHLQKSLNHTQYCGDLEKYLEFFRNGNCVFGPYFEHVKQAKDKIGSENMLFIFFEEFKKDLRTFLKKLSEFLEIKLSEEQLKQLEEHMSFENFSKAMNGRVRDKNNQPLQFVRKGTAGGWKEYFTEKMNEETDKWIEVNAKSIGIKYFQLEE